MGFAWNVVGLRADRRPRQNRWSGAALTNPTYEPRSRLLHPELIHGGEGGGPLAFELPPVFESPHAGIVGKPLPIGGGDGGRKLEAGQSKIKRAEQGFDLRDGETMLLHVEQQVAALAHAEEIVELLEASKLACQQGLAAFADAARRRLKAALGAKRTPRNDVAAGELAVETHPHQAGRPQQPQQSPPPRPGVGQMVAPPPAAAEGDRAARPAELEYIGLRVGDVVEAELARLAPRVAEAGETEVDGEQPRAGELLRHADRMLAGAAARDQDVHVALAERAERSEGKSLPEIVVDRNRRAPGRCQHPARIRIFLVLLSDLKGR